VESQHSVFFFPLRHKGPFDEKDSRPAKIAQEKTRIGEGKLKKRKREKEPKNAAIAGSGE
jgi:hypothetical protein